MKRAIAAAARVVVVITGVRLQSGRVHTGGDLAWVHREEVLTVARALAAEGKVGRKQGRNGTENQWANLMPYTYGRTPALLQMGGAGLQSSPNYVFLWEEKDITRTAWIFDGPYVMFARANAAKIPDGVTVVVDYAHTDDALRNLIETARPLTAGRVITLFGLSLIHI